MCVSIERELLTGNSRLGSKLSIAVGTSLVHSAIDAGGTDRTGEGFVGVDGLLLAPKHFCVVE